MAQPVITYHRATCKTKPSCTLQSKLISFFQVLAEFRYICEAIPCIHAEHYVNCKGAWDTVPPVTESYSAYVFRLVLPTLTLYKLSMIGGLQNENLSEGQNLDTAAMLLCTNSMDCQPGCSNTERRVKTK